ncbi:ornithine decarboxylase antizyme 1 [Cimex lectularius]|uniref:Ornithine decarboxylase antizyme n=1 Tax=Cimex lectularius TaxID=79782 RepID=A0A8I6TB96_CIMLE|nr:ornithine decarboxylase antizyme 1 [Cimex lectularius]
MLVRYFDRLYVEEFAKEIIGIKRCPGMWALTAPYNLGDAELVLSKKRRAAPIIKCSLAQGLCGAPDVPHIQYPSNRIKYQEIDLEAILGRGGVTRITFELRLTEQTEAVWDTLLLGTRLYIQVPQSLLPDGSKEAFITLLEYAEEVLKCTDIIVCLKKDRADRAQLVRTFMYLGFAILPPGHELLLNSNDTINLYMRYAIE